MLNLGKGIYIRAESLTNTSYDKLKSSNVYNLKNIQSSIKFTQIKILAEN